MSKMTLALAHRAAMWGKFDIALSKFAISAVGKSPYANDKPKKLPQKTILFPLLDWFDFNHQKLYQSFLDRGVLCVPVNPNLPEFGKMTFREHLENLWKRSDRYAENVTANNWKQLEYKGISLWVVARYEICIDCEASIEGLETQIDKYLDRICLHYNRAVQQIDLSLDLVRHYQPMAILIAQGYPLACSVLRHIAVSQGIRVIALENTMHKDRLLWDDCSGITVNRGLARNYWWRHQDHIRTQDAGNFVDDYFGNVSGLKQDEHASPDATFAGSADGKKTIFYIGQISTDASILFGLDNGFTDQIDVIKTVMRFAQNEGFSLLVKLHPKEHKGKDPLYRDYRKLTLRKLLDDPEAKSLIDQGLELLDSENEYDSYDLIAGADVCVTINSQAGLEALAMGKEVVICGDSFYGGLGMTHEATDPKELETCLRRVLVNGVGKNQNDTAQRFFYNYLENYCVPKNEESVIKIVCGN